MIPLRYIGLIDFKKINLRDLDSAVIKLKSIRLFMSYETKNKEQTKD